MSDHKIFSNLQPIDFPSRWVNIVSLWLCHLPDFRSLKHGYDRMINPELLWADIMRATWNIAAPEASSVSQCLAGAITYANAASSWSLSRCCGICGIYDGKIREINSQLHQFDHCTDLKLP